MNKENIIKIIQTRKYDEETDQMVDHDKENGELTAYYSASRQLGDFIMSKKFNYIVQKIQDNPNFKTIIYSVFMANCLILLKRILAQNNIKYVDIDGTVDTQKFCQKKTNKFESI